MAALPETTAAPVQKQTPTVGNHQENIAVSKAVTMKKILAVIGGSKASANETDLARQVGELAAKKGYVVATGGLGGVMEAASKGARHAGGLVVGIIPFADKQYANPYVDIAIASGLGHARNIVLVQTADVVVAVGGSYGTLSEIAIALKEKKTVLGFGSWTIDGVVQLSTIEDLDMHI